MADIYQFASQQWKMIPHVRDEIIDELEEEGKGEAFEEMEALLGEQLAAAQTVEERQAWGQNVLALIQGVPEVREALGLPSGGHFGYNWRTKKYALKLAARRKTEEEHDPAIEDELYQPQPDEKPSRIQQLLNWLQGRS